MIALYLLVAAVLLVGALWLLGGWLAARVVSRPRRPSIFDVLALTPYELRVPFSDAHFVANDGWPLFGWWIPCEGARRAIVLCSGYRSNKSEVVSLAPFLRDRGFSILAFDLRGQGGSGFCPVTFAHREWRDVAAAVREAQGRVGGGPVGVLGFSMGGAAAILAAAAGAPAAAVACDSAYAEAADVVARYIRSWAHLPGRALVPVGDFFLRRRLGFRLRDVRPTDVVARVSPRPLLLIHGEDDSIVPIAHAQELYRRAADPKALWVVPGANHVGAYFTHRDEYLRRVGDFFAENMIPPSP